MAKSGSFTLSNCTDCLLMCTALSKKTKNTQTTKLKITYRVYSLTNDSLTIPTCFYICHVGMVANFLQLNLVIHSGSRKDEVVMHVPDGVVTLQTAPSSNDPVDQGNQNQQHLSEAPAPEWVNLVDTDILKPDLLNNHN